MTDPNAEPRPPCGTPSPFPPYGGPQGAGPVGGYPPAQPPPAFTGYPAPEFAGPTSGEPTLPSSRASRPGFDNRGHVRRTRVSGVWIGLITAAVVLIVLVIFIAQNTNKASIHFLGFNGRLSIGLMILIAAIFGLLIAAVPGTIRIVQLRRALKLNAPIAGDHRSR